MISFDLAARCGKWANVHILNKQVDCVIIPISATAATNVKANTQKNSITTYRNEQKINVVEEEEEKEK